MVENDRVPHATLFHGPSGCGKTTLGRILAAKLKCEGSDLQEVNAASCRGIEEMRAIERRMYSAPIQSKSRVWILDEAHQLTGDAQTALLKVLEDPPSHSYFILCTTLPNKLKETVRNRCTKFQVKLLSESQMEELVKSVAKKESLELDNKVLEAIVQHAMGMPRVGLVLLESVMGLDSTEKQIKAVSSVTAKEQAFTLIKMLLWERAKFPKVAKFLSEFEEEAEQFRRFILAVAKTELLKCNPKTMDQAYQIINAFRDNYFDSDHAGLAASAYEVCTGK
jgi:DNA polymerase-3 subunit gamma/tau